MGFPRRVSLVPFTGRRAELLLLVALLLSLAPPVLAAYGSGKKSKFMAAYPAIFKFCLFWWCVFVFVVMFFYISDHLLWRKFGAAKVAWSAERAFKAASGGREEYWAQLVDPTRWAPNHPVLQSADIRMVRCGDDDADKSRGGSEDAKDDEPLPNPHATVADEGLAVPSAKLRPVELQPLAVGLGFILRHKPAEVGPRTGSFFCTRKCTLLETPTEGKWRMVMRTIEAGNGYPFQPDSEVAEVEMDPPAEDGSVRCAITGSAETNSRIFRWWNGLEPNSRAASEDMLEVIENLVLHAKKRD